MKNIFVFLILFIVLNGQAQTYASRLGWKPTDKVIILHVDDVGMSYESNHGAIDAMEKGIARSCSIMMPCPWVPEYFHYLKDHPLTDAGLHLTLTSEWKDYRWGPLAGVMVVPGLVDKEGAMYSDVASVLSHASPAEIDTEIRAQLHRSRSMGWEPTHLDSHMGTLFASPAYLAKYIQLSFDEHIPIMLPVGHNTLMLKTNPVDEQTMTFLHETGQKLWDSGLPVIDDLHNFSYGWVPPITAKTKSALRLFKTKKYIESFKDLKPGITFVIMHCSIASEMFPHITSSGPTRHGDLETMMDPEFKKYLDKEGIIITTWREMAARRKKIE
ncbi:MAG: polysaccharide deacetylase family protein [Saprospiraceae bacterium]